LNAFERAHEKAATSVDTLRLAVCQHAIILSRNLLSVNEKAASNTPAADREDDVHGYFSGLVDGGQPARFVA